MAEESLEKIDEKTPKDNSKLVVYLAAFIPMLLMVIGFFVVTKFINPYFGFGNIAAGSGKVSGDGSSNSSTSSNRSESYKKGESVIYELGSVLANPLGTQGKRFAKIGVSLELSSKSLIKQIDEGKSRLQHQLILILSSKDVETLASPQGKNALLEEIRSAMIAQLELSDGDITHIYFSEFIIQ